VICDEVDAYKWDVGGEGDPMTLIENRQRTYSRAKTFLVSTPTVADESRIDQAYQRSDRRRYHVPCPHCGEFHHLKFDNLKYRTEIAEEPSRREPSKPMWSSTRGTSANPAAPRSSEAKRRPCSRAAGGSPSGRA
jgi:phage terminase large subunit GpA-like protein